MPHESESDKKERIARAKAEAQKKVDKKRKGLSFFGAFTKGTGFTRPRSK